MGQIFNIMGLYEDLEFRRIFHLAMCQLLKLHSFLGSNQQSD